VTKAKQTRSRQGGQQFIGRNRAPRVQIEYDVEIYGSERKVEIPFVMGVMADLAGDTRKPLPEIGERKFLEVDIDNLDERMKSIQPRAAFQVPNKLGGDGRLQVDLTFESMDDFTPGRIARNVEPLSHLLEARTQLANLLSYMDGKNGAEELLAKALADPALLKALAKSAKPQHESDAPPDDAHPGEEDAE
jgi:type VI secretion system protein ImpB